MNEPQRTAGDVLIHCETVELDINTAEQQCDDFKAQIFGAQPCLSWIKQGVQENLKVKEFFVCNNRSLDFRCGADSFKYQLYTQFSSSYRMSFQHLPSSKSRHSLKHTLF